MCNLCIYHSYVVKKKAKNYGQPVILKLYNNKSSAKDAPIRDKQKYFSNSFSHRLFLSGNWFPHCGIKREIRCKSGAIPVAVSSVNGEWSMVNVNCT
jgi:hypothetical protein